MSFVVNFEPLTDEEIKVQSMSHLLPDGDYPFEIIKSEKVVNEKSGNIVIRLTHRTWNKEGKEKIIYGSLVMTPTMMWLVKHYCKSTGQLSVYDSKQFTQETFDNKKGFFTLAQEPEKPNPKGGVFKAKNVVVDYILKDNSPKPFSQAEDFFKDDEVPNFLAENK